MSNEDQVPKARVVSDDKTGAAPASGDGPPAPAFVRAKHKRRLSNYLLDKRLQLRYLILVTVLSTVIAGTLGALIYTQQHDASDDVTAGIAALGDEDLVATVKDQMAERDRSLVLKMAGAGVGMIVILSVYLLVMTHKVAGPLYKCALYFDKMAAGKLGKVTALRKGDMLNDFYDGFREMHDAVRGRQIADNQAMRRFLDACDAAGVERTGALGEELAVLDKHVTERKKCLVDFPT